MKKTMELLLLLHKNESNLEQLLAISDIVRNTWDLEIAKNTNQLNCCTILHNDKLLKECF